MTEFKRELTELKSSVRRLTDKQRLSKDFSLLCELTVKSMAGIIKLEKRWRGSKGQPLTQRKRVMRRDLNSLMHRLNTSIPNGENVFDWEIKSTQEALDFLPALFPYLKKVGFEACLLEVSHLLEDIRQAEKHSKILDLLIDISKTKDSVTTSQFRSNEMVGYLKYLSKDRSQIARVTLLKHIQIYQELCGIYEKDILVCYCLLQIKGGNKPNYTEIRKNTPEIQDRINFVRSHMAPLVKPWDRIVRNAKAHSDIEVDSRNRLVRFYERQNQGFKQYSFEEVVSLTREMSATVSVFSLLPIILANGDWKALKAMLDQSG